LKNLKIPYKKLHIFKLWLGLDESGLARLEPLRHLFTSRKEDFARYFHDYFMEIPEARLIIEHEEKPGRLLNAWANWFESLFSGGFNDNFLGYLWRVGLRHVEVNLDQRFSVLGFSVVRQFCQKLVRAEIPPDEATGILNLVDRMIDYCILVETDAYIEGLTRCDFEIMKGIADRIRNPITVIGGNINRLMKKTGLQDPAYPVYEFISSQSAKCEGMLRDIRTYMEVLEREPVFEKVSLEDLLQEVLNDLLSRGLYKKPRIEMNIGDDASHILADSGDMKALFDHIIENSLQALEEKNPFIRISSTTDGAPPHSLIVEVFNTGTPLREEDAEKLFSPFYSTKPGGTGFGLPIARQAARKNLGRLRIERVRDEGTRVIISLSLYE
jgi:signal transduction histidine kinase